MGKVNLPVCNCLAAHCFGADIAEGGSSRRPGTSVVSSASMSVLHSSSLRDYTPASRSENQDSLQVGFVRSLAARALLLVCVACCPVFAFTAVLRVSLPPS